MWTPATQHPSAGDPCPSVEEEEVSWVDISSGDRWGEGESRFAAVTNIHMELLRVGLEVEVPAGAGNSSLENGIL